MHLQTFALSLLASISSIQAFPPLRPHPSSTPSSSPPPPPTSSSLPLPLPPPTTISTSPFATTTTPPASSPLTHTQPPQEPAQPANLALLLRAQRNRERAVQYEKTVATGCYQWWRDPAPAEPYCGGKIAEARAWVEEMEGGGGGGEA